VTAAIGGVTQTSKAAGWFLRNWNLIRGTEEVVCVGIVASTGDLLLVESKWGDPDDQGMRPWMFIQETVEGSEGVE